MILGAGGGFLCFYAVQLVKNTFKIDDSLDVFAVHGVGGILGSLLVAVLATASFGGPGLSEGQTIGGQLSVQAIGVIATVIWSIVATFIILKVAGALTGGIRVPNDDEVEGLDLAAHGERGYDLR